MTFSAPKGLGSKHRGTKEKPFLKKMQVVTTLLLVDTLLFVFLRLRFV